MSFGTDLRQERESRQVSLASIAEATRVSVRHLQALEADTPQDLPGGVFNRGIVRSYCQYLGLAEEEWLARFSAAGEAEGGEPDWAAFAENVRRNRTPSPSTGPRWWGVALMVIVVAAAAWVTWHFLLKRRFVSSLTQPSAASEAVPSPAQDAVADRPPSP